MTHSMRERLIAKIVAIAPNHIGTPDDDQSIDSANAGELVNAILTELRVPDDGMELAALGMVEGATDPQDVFDAFTAMIDHIRGGQP